MRNRLPSYRLHKPSGLAVVTLGGKDFYLGRYGSPESKAEYARLLAEYTANGHRLPVESDLTLAELALRYLDHVEAYYRRPDGSPTSEVALVKRVLRLVRELYGHVPAKDFDCTALKTVRQKMVEAGWVRTSVNLHIYRVRRMFRWAASENLVPVEVYQRLTTLEPLRRGRSPARESEPVRPVDDATVDATLAHLPPVVADMVRLQRLTGMRPGEVCALRLCDLDRQGEVWTYTPAAHKCAWRGQERVVAIGPRAQAILRPYLEGRDPQVYAFSPAESVAKLREEKRAKRRTPLWRSHLKAQAKKRKKHPKRPPAEAYTVASYRRAIARACQKAGVEPWHPHQLRHTAATVVRRAFGLEAAQAVLGHSDMRVTEVYAERRMDLAFAVVREIG